MEEKLSPRMDFTAQPKPATALCGVVSADGKIAYPPGVKEITDKITTDEMIKRLKVKWPPGSLPGRRLCLLSPSAWPTHLISNLVLVVGLKMVLF